MKRKRITITRLLMIVALLSMTLLVSVAPAKASPSNKFITKYLFAMAGSEIPSEGVTTSVSVNPYHVTWKYEKGKPNTATMLSISIVQYQFEPEFLFTPIIDETVEIPDTAFSIDKKLTTATLDVTVNVFNIESNSNVDVTINLDWTSIGSVMKFSDNWHSKSDYSITNGHYSNVFREAMAVGSISMTDFSVSEWMFAELDYMKESMVDVPKF